jgi:hypothetical protein
VTGQQSVQVAAVPVRPIEHGGNAKAMRGKWGVQCLHRLSWFSLRDLDRNNLLQPLSEN